MRRNQSGFTLIELLIVISIIGVLAAVLLPNILGAQRTANAFADEMQMRTHFSWFTIYQQRHKKALPREGGYKFVLSTWTSKIFDHTEENLDKYFTPGWRDNDPDYRTAREMMERGEDPWPTIDDTRSTDTHYVGRARAHLRTATQSELDAWMATDNENDSWVFSDGTVNVLFNGGTVRSYSYQTLQDNYGLGDLDLDHAVVTYGPNSPIVPCQTRDN